MLFRYFRLWAILLIAGISGAAAQSTSPQEADMQKAFVAATNAATQGPADVPLRKLATIHLPDSYSFIPLKEGAELMRSMGNATDENFHGLIISKQPDQYWFVTIDYRDSGHVKDDDAKSWNADELLQSIKDGTEAGNKERTERGFAALDVVGWVEPPAYDAGTHRLVWSMLAKERGNSAQGATINYNTYALGRQGYFELNLVTSEDAIGEDKKHAGTILAALDYKPGERYTDFDAATDRVAEYGLAALIGGIAAKKLGLLAIIGVAFVKLWKFILIALAVAGGGLVKMFRRKNTTPQA
jgi:uncharacterized membrane-anchored protein